MKSRDKKYYTLYLSNSDTPSAFGTNRECAEMLGVKLGDFISMICRIKKGIVFKWTLVVEDEKGHVKTYKATKKRKKVKPPKPKIKYDDNFRTNVYNMYKNGMTYYAIGKKMNMNQGCVRAIVKKYEKDHNLTS